MRSGAEKCRRTREMATAADLRVKRIATRTASSTSTLQHNHTSAVRKCAAVLKETPRPPPSARYAAMHIGHFGISASAMLGNANAAAPRVRRAGRLSGF
jgi:hypothetical protein